MKSISTNKLLPKQLSNRMLTNHRLVKLYLTPTVLISAIFLASCSEAPQESAESVSDAASAVQQSTLGLEGNDSNFEVESLSKEGEQTLGSQVTEINIDGKDLMISASANFEVDDVVKSRNQIESVTRQQGGYIAHSSIASKEVSSHTYTQQDKNIRLTTY